MRVFIPASTDVLISAPLQRPALFTGRIAAIDQDRITFAGEPGWAEGALVYAQSIQPETYYGQIDSGALRGAFFTIVGNDSSTLTLDLNGETLDAVAAGDILTLRPYWTLGTLLGEGSGFPGSPTFTPRAEVQFFSATASGINLATSQRFFYYEGTGFGGPGWRRAGSALTSKFDNTILYPDTPFRIRNSGAVIQFSHTGDAPLAGHRTPVGTLASDVPQDNLMALMSAADTTLGTSDLVESGAVIGSPTFTPVDSVILFDNATAGINKASAGVYFYYTGAGFGGPGWRKTGGGLATLQDSKILSAQDGFIIRKGRTSSPQTTPWTHRPAYAQGN